MATFNTGVRINLDLEQAREQVDELEQEVEEQKKTAERAKPSRGRRLQEIRAKQKNRVKEKKEKRDLLDQVSRIRSSLFLGKLATTAISFLGALPSFAQGIAGSGDLVGQGGSDPFQGKRAVKDPENKQGRRQLLQKLNALESTVNSLSVQIPALREAFGQSTQINKARSLLGSPLNGKQAVDNFKMFREFNVAQKKFEKRLDAEALKRTVRSISDATLFGANGGINK